VRAVAIGTATVTAVAEGRSATSRVAVRAAPGTVDHVALNAVSETLEEGSSLQLIATAFDANNNVITGRGVRWSSSEPGTVGVEPDGMIIGLRVGIVSVTATIDGRSASATIRVSADWQFDLTYGAADVGVPDELHALDITDPAAHPMPVFPPGRQATHGAPSPDGSRIAFVVHGEWDGSTWPSMIFVANRDGSNSQRLTWNAARNTEPAWSPDGRQIAFTSQPWGEAADIWVMDADGSNAVRITGEQAGSKRSPAWSSQPVGGHIRLAYSQEAGGSAYIWSMRTDGTDKQLITGDPAYFDSEPAWSPDGRTLVFQRTGNATFGDLYLVGSTGGATRPLMPRFALMHGQFSPAWSPDGRLIAFSSKHQDGEHYQIWTVWSDGTRLAQRTTDLRSHSDPSWIAKR
jgi:Tol biopolymer transport system component